MTTSAGSPEGKEALARAKRYLLARPESSVIDDYALKFAGLPMSEKRVKIRSAADDFEVELRRRDASPEFVRAARATFEVLLFEKIAVAEAGGASCQLQ